MKYLLLIFTCIIISGNEQGQSSVELKPDHLKIRTEAGIISGKQTPDEAVSIFMGIPYAAPPVGQLRWKPPQPVAAWKGTRQCVTPPPSAMQAKPAPFMMWSKEFMAPEEPLSEDCLYLNIWTSAKRSSDRLPVIMWIHGGAFTGGSGTVPLYDGEEMARKGVVFVTINYRLGVFGFLSHPWLSQESPDKVSGNYGILDQIEALKWIGRNIEAFGGDPERVTIAGQSAGSFSVNALMVSPLAKGLFHRAIGQSGGMFSGNPGLVYDMKSAEVAGAKYTEQVKASSLEELRSKPAEVLMKAQGRWGIVIDNHVVVSATEAFRKGTHNDVPLISGWNADDGVSMGGSQDAVTFRKNAETRYGNLAPDFLKAFPSSTDEEARSSQKIASVLGFGWQNYNWAKMQSMKGEGKAYLYFFTRVPPGEPDYGAFHSAEFGYALKTLKLWDRPFTKTDTDLSETMSSYWVNFAANGNPNGPGLPEWPFFDTSIPEVMVFGNETEKGPLPFREQLEFFDKFNNHQLPITNHQ